jgi:hypothetical protein
MSSFFNKVGETVSRYGSEILDGFVDNAAEGLGILGEKVGDYFQNTQKTVLTMADSTALSAVTTATIKNAAYIYSEEGEQELYEAAIARGRYLEAAVVSLACVVTNLVMSAGFGIAALVTGCEDARLNFAGKKFLLMAGYSCASMGVGAIGIFSPTEGSNANVNLIQAIYDNRQSISSFLGDA